MISVRRALFAAAVTAAGLLGSFVVLVGACEEVESVSVSETPLSATRLQEIAERGWLPSFLPTPADSLVLRYNLDTNRRCASFKYASAQLSEIEENAVRVGFSPGPTPPAPRRISSLKPCPFTESDLRGSTILTRSGPHGGIYSEALAISRAASHVYFWDFVE